VSASKPINVQKINKEIKPNDVIAVVHMSKTEGYIILLDLLIVTRKPRLVDNKLYLYGYFLPTHQPYIWQVGQIDELIKALDDFIVAKLLPKFIHTKPIEVTTQIDGIETIIKVNINTEVKKEALKNIDWS